MGRARDISDLQKVAISTLLKQKLYSYREIARKEGVSYGTVGKIAKNLKSGLSPRANKRKNCRGKRKTTPRMDRKIISTALEHRNAPIRALNAKMQEEGINLSAVTLRRRLYEANIKCRRPAKRPRITEAMKKKRLIWAKLHKNYTESDWDKVIFSDECRLEALTESTQFVRRRPEERYRETCVVTRVKHPPSVMIWGCITSEGPGPLRFVEGNLRQDQYKTILRDELLPFMDSLPLERSEYTFMQDGAPCHTAASIKSFFDEEEIVILPWPGNSPDMNPIENCWARLKSIVYQRQNTNVNILKENIKDVWDNDLDFKNLVIRNMKSMTNRIKELLKAKGGFTKY